SWPAISSSPVSSYGESVGGASAATSRIRPAKSTMRRNTLLIIRSSACTASPRRHPYIPPALPVPYPYDRLSAHPLCVALVHRGRKSTMLTPTEKFLFILL